MWTRRAVLKTALVSSLGAHRFARGATDIKLSSVIFDVEISIEWNYCAADRKIFADIPTLKV